MASKKRKQNVKRPEDRNAFFVAAQKARYAWARKVDAVAVAAFEAKANGERAGI